LPHDAIPPVWGKIHGHVTEAIIRELRFRSVRRLEASVPFRYIALERERLKKEREQNRVSLQEAERRAEMERQEQAYLSRLKETPAAPKGTVFAPVRMEDLRLKALLRSEGDLLKSEDPEWSAMEEETVSIARDFIGLWKPARGGS
jgi:hypothetical protein